MKLPPKTRAELNLLFLSGSQASQFATASQGAKADTALQDPSAFATAAQGAEADAAYGWGDHAASVASAQASANAAQVSANSAQASADSAQADATSALSRNPLFLGTLSIREQLADGVSGGAVATPTSWTTRAFTAATLVNTIPGASFATNTFHLPAGTYLFQASSPAYRPGSHCIALFDSLDLLTPLANGSAEFGGATSTTTTRSHLLSVNTFSVDIDVVLRHYLVAPLGNTTDLGGSLGAGHGESVYSQMLIVRLA